MFFEKGIKTKLNQYLFDNICQKRYNALKMRRAFNFRYLIDAQAATS